MTVLGVSMGALIGLPPSLVEIYGGDIKKMYKANGVPLYFGCLLYTSRTNTRSCSRNNALPRCFRSPSKSRNPARALFWKGWTTAWSNVQSAATRCRGTISSVSYTHLDVYKRQAVDGLRAAARVAQNFSPAP